MKSPEGHMENTAFSYFTSRCIHIKLHARGGEHIHHCLCIHLYQIFTHQTGFRGNLEAACGLLVSTFITLEQ